MLCGVTTMVTIKLQLLQFPAWSVGVQVLVVVPSGNAVPDGELHTGVTEEQSSDTVSANVTAAVPWPGSGVLVMLPGQVICGGVVSKTGVTVTSPTTPSGC